MEEARTRLLSVVVPLRMVAGGKDVVLGRAKADTWASAIVEVFDSVVDNIFACWADGTKD